MIGKSAVRHARKAPVLGYGVVSGIQPADGQVGREPEVPGGVQRQGADHIGAVPASYKLVIRDTACQRKTDKAVARSGIDVPLAVVEQVVDHVRGESRFGPEPCDKVHLLVVDGNAGSEKAYPQPAHAVEEKGPEVILGQDVTGGVTPECLSVPHINGIQAITGPHPHGISLFLEAAGVEGIQGMPQAEKAVGDHIVAPYTAYPIIPAGVPGHELYGLVGERQAAARAGAQVAVEEVDAVSLSPDYHRAIRREDDRRDVFRRHVIGVGEAGKHRGFITYEV